MNRFTWLHVLVAVVLTVVAGAGCQKKSPESAAGKPAAKPTMPTPEESFAGIVETFRRGIEEVPLGFAVRDASGGRTMMTARNSVSHELLPPQKDGEPFKAKITVRSDTQYSVQRSTEPVPVESQNQSQDAAVDGSTNGDPGVQIFDPSVASAPGSSERPASSGKTDKNGIAFAQTENKYERTYELVHENGRWKLVTKLDPNTEESIKVAFDHALNSQS